MILILILPIRMMLIRPNRHSTSNRRRFDVDVASAWGRPNFDEFPRNFHVLFRCNFADRKIHVVSTYFFQRNFDGRKIHVVSTYFFRCNFDGPIIRYVCTYFFDKISINSTSLLVSCKLIKTFEGFFLC